MNDLKIKLTPVLLSKLPFPCQGPCEHVTSFTLHKRSLLLDGRPQECKMYYYHYLLLGSPSTRFFVQKSNLSHMCCEILEYSGKMIEWEDSVLIESRKNYTNIFTGPPTRPMYEVYLKSHRSP